MWEIKLYEIPQADHACSHPRRGTVPRVRAVSPWSCPLRSPTLPAVFWWDDTFPLPGGQPGCRSPRVCAVGREGRRSPAGGDFAAKLCNYFIYIDVKSFFFIRWGPPIAAAPQALKAQRKGFTVGLREPFSHCFIRHYLNLATCGNFWGKLKRGDYVGGTQGN